MPFEIVRNDITNMQVDAVVNTANPRAIVGYGVDSGIHKKAGPKLLEARKAIGDIMVGQAAITPGFDLDADYVIHAVGPLWQDGKHNEEQLLRQCYDNALRLALEHKCESIAFPLLSAGNHGFPKKIALQTAINAFSSFLMDHEMQIYLVVFSRAAVELSEKLVHDVASYIDETYIFEKQLDEYGVFNERSIKALEQAQLRRALEETKYYRQQRAFEDEWDANADFCIFPSSASAPSAPSAISPMDLGTLLEQTDAGFSETLLKLIDRTGKKDSDIYKKANVDRRLFSKIKNDPNYRPSKETALAFALALELDIHETKDLIGRAGYTLTHSSKFDIIVEYFIQNRIYDVIEANLVLHHFDQPLLRA